MQKPAGNGKSKAAIVVLVILLVLMAGLGAAGVLLKHGNTIYPNVTLCGVQVGEKTTAEAEKLVKAAMADSYGVTDMVVQFPDRELVFEADKAKVSLDMEYALKKALSYGREGNIFSCLMSWFECKKTSYDVDITSAFTMDTGYLRQVAEDLKNEVSVTMQDSNLSYNPETQVLTVFVGVKGVSLDTQKLVNTVMDAYSRGEFTGTKFNYDVTLYNPVNLSEFYREYCTPVRNSVYDPEKGILTDEVIGFGFDLEAAQQQVNMASEGETLIFPLAEILPTVTKEQLHTEMFSDVLAEYQSPHVYNPPRTVNLELACQFINGTILDVGQVFSFNDIVGERTAARGFQYGIVYGEGGTSEPGLGGGVCQVASTLYMASLLADFEIVQRAPHMFAVDYVPLGMDATIYWDTGLDFKFRNNTGSPMLIEAFVKDGYVNIIYHGVENKDYTIEMSYKILKTLEWEDEYTLDTSKPEGYREVTVTPYTGYNVVTYKTKIDANGKKISTTQEAYSNFIKRNRQVLVGPGVLGEDGKPWDPNFDVNSIPETALPEPEPVAPAPDPVIPIPDPVTPAPDVDIDLI